MRFYFSFLLIYYTIVLIYIYKLITNNITRMIVWAVNGHIDHIEVSEKRWKIRKENTER
jgi:hypothetical protein